MSDELDQPGTEETQEPSLQEQIRQIIAGEFDGRFQGLQSSLDKRLGGLAKDVDSLKTAQLTPEEQEQREINESERLRRENALLRLSREYPEEVQLLEQFFAADNLEDQVQALAGFRKVTAPETPAEEAATPKPTPVAGNNPRRDKRGSLADPVSMQELIEDPELVDQILEAADEPGMLVRIRKMLGQ